MGRPKPPLVLRPEESEQLRAVAASRTLPHGLVRRARIILLSASGMSNQALAARLDLNPVTVGHWRRRFLPQGLSGLHDELRPGRPRSLSDARVAALIGKTLQTRPKQDTHWSCRSRAAQTRRSKTTVHRIWRAFGLQPHRQRQRTRGQSRTLRPNLQCPGESVYLDRDGRFNSQKDRATW